MSEIFIHIVNGIRKMNILKMFFKVKNQCEIKLKKPIKNKGQSPEIKIMFLPTFYIL